LSIWLGLRPEEIDSLHDKSKFKIEFLKDKKISVIKVYQSKLQSISRDRRWKLIPLIFPEQTKCLEIIESGEFKRPLHKTVRKYCGQGITLYGGRKGFVDLMLSLEQKLEDISTTWQSYKKIYALDQRPQLKLV
jgi:hypothetical protein